MACSLKSVVCVSGLNENVLRPKPKGVSGFRSLVGFSESTTSKSKARFTLDIDFRGEPMVLSDEKGFRDCSSKTPTNFSLNAQASTCISRAMRWWEKTRKPNMIEIHSAQELVHYLLNAGDTLVVVDFYSPGCGGCKALHPKICQLAELYPNAMFLQINYEELKTMCHSLHIHVLPFFRFYRGAEGRVCSFSCTISTIKKFKDALAKHGTDRCSLGPAKGLDESELKNLASMGELTVNSPLIYPKVGKMEGFVLGSDDYSGIWGKPSNNMEVNQGLLC
ncbi:hypothetical protein L6164_014563 [Bauhinia variegata]|uniref:Uncharacterized protein n=1 Tax=Bauhinia variegata TaxID=167791 RepID=A0ACB9NJE0_BAUVA|nr:hypothetical protein L6164_014563 [Bauhinia variegata]